MQKLSGLKRQIVDVVTEQTTWKRTVKPVTAILERILQEKKMLRIIKMKDFSNLNKCLDPEFRLDDSEIITLLKHLHQAGTLLYFEETDIIVLDVQWLVDAFKSILAYNVGIEKGHDIEPHHFKVTGELNDEQLDAIWNRQENDKKDFKIHKNVLTSYMEKLGLLVCISEPPTWYYFPSMNKRKFVEGEFKGLKHSSILTFRFKREKQRPFFIFYKLVIRCMKLFSWKIQIEKQSRLLYDDVACLSFKGHVILLCVHNFQIQVQVLFPSKDIETNVLKEIKSMLESIMEEFRNQNYEFEIGYKCQNGTFRDQELNFIPETELTNGVNDHLCTFCTNKRHFVGKEICWVSSIFAFLILISGY